MHKSSDNLLHPKYRPDVDGLRALAVLSVIVFHAFPERLPGGFVGVDIFFVISGYLISTIIFSNLESGKFSFMEFYARRVKRIYPALLIVMAAILAFGWYALLADEFKQLGKHVMAGSGFVSNLVLWSESGYFDNAAESKPLLHLWSLGIEEQFYIVWPLLVWMSWRSRLGLLSVTVVALITSFLMNIYGIGQDAVATFYSPLTRFWELSSGSLLAYLVLHKKIDSAKFTSIQANSIAAVGFVLLICAIALTKKNYAFPGWWALLPVFGAVLVIAAGPRCWLNTHVLSNKLAVWVGLISFPAYLWHWPLLAFGRIIEGKTPGWAFRVGAVFASLLLAWLTYRYVERFVRSGRGFRIVPGLIASSVAIAVAGYYVYDQDGLASRSAVKDSGFTEAVRGQFTGPLWAYTKNDACLTRYRFKDADKLAWWFCMKSDERSPTIAILGNSFANQLYPGFAKNPLLRQHSILSIGTCDFAALKGSQEGDPRGPCYGDRAATQKVFIDDLLMNESSIRFAIIDGLRQDPSPDYIDSLRRRIDLLERKGMSVIVFTPHLKPSFHPKACFTTPLRKVARDCSFPEQEITQLVKQFEPLVESIGRTNPKVRFFDQNVIFCRDHQCSLVRDGMPLHRDEGHLSEYASIALQTYFAEWAKINAPEMF